MGMAATVDPTTPADPTPIRTDPAPAGPTGGTTKPPNVILGKLDTYTAAGLGALKAAELVSVCQHHGIAFDVREKQDAMVQRVRDWVTKQDASSGTRKGKPDPDAGTAVKEAFKKATSNKPPVEDAAKRQVKDKLGSGQLSMLALGRTPTTCTLKLAASSEIEVATDDGRFYMPIGDDVNPADLIGMPVGRYVELRVIAKVVECGVKEVKGGDGLQLKQGLDVTSMRVVNAKHGGGTKAAPPNPVTQAKKAAAKAAKEAKPPVAKKPTNAKPPAKKPDVKAKAPAKPKAVPTAGK